MLSARTEHDYRQYVRRWKREGEPDPKTWVAGQSSEATQRNARAALVWWHRVELGQALALASVPQTRHAVKALTVEEVAVLRDVALGVHRRCQPTLNLLYSTGARLGELCAVELSDVTATHVVLRETKRRPGGLRVERSIPLSATSRNAVDVLRGMPAGRTNTLLGACRHAVQDWMVTLQRRSGIRCHAHLWRATFATRMLERGADVRVVQELMGHTSLATTLRYLAVTDERLASAVALL